MKRLIYILEKLKEEKVVVLMQNMIRALKTREAEAGYPFEVR